MSIWYQCSVSRSSRQLIDFVDILIENSNKLLNKNSFIVYDCIILEKINGMNVKKNQIIKEKLWKKKLLQFNLVTPQRDHCMPLK